MLYSSKSIPKTDMVDGSHRKPLWALKSPAIKVEGECRDPQNVPTHFGKEISKKVGEGEKVGRGSRDKK